MWLLFDRQQVADTSVALIVIDAVGNRSAYFGILPFCALIMNV